MTIVHIRDRLLAVLRHQLRRHGLLLFTALCAIAFVALAIEVAAA